jgi:hypothetical protein
MSYRRTADMPGYDGFNADYIAAGFPNFGTDADVWGAFAYDAAMIIIDAIQRADSINPDEIRNAIASTANHLGVVGTYEGFDSNGDVIPQWNWLMHYQGGTWNQLSGTTFSDVLSDHWAYSFIESIWAAGLTAGFPDGTYRPDNPVTRAEMAVFLKKGINGSAYTPLSPDGTYRPENQVTRAEIAVFLVNAFSLPLP